MSTYFYFECLSHDPALRSDGEISQHDDWNVEEAVKMAQGINPVPAEPWEAFSGQTFQYNAAMFLIEHPRCAIGLVTEYGDHRPIPGRGADTDRAAIERMLIRGREARDQAQAAMKRAEAQIVQALAEFDAITESG